MFLFCVESSRTKGMGHLFRAINLHNILKSKKLSSVIALLNSDSSSISWLAQNMIPYAVVKNSGNADWELELISKYKPHVWINDRMDTSISHARRLKEQGLGLVTFDDLGGGAELSDVHVAPLAEFRSTKLQGVKRLEGLEYLIFPQEISELRGLRKKNDKWLVTLGGSDTHGVTVSVIKWLIEHSRKATIILGPSFAHEFKLTHKNLEMLTIKKSVPSMMNELARHDFAITGGGITSFEAAAHGVPTAVIANEKWEISYAKFLESQGCSIFLGTAENFNLKQLNVNLDVEEMSKRALDLISLDGSEKIVGELLKLRRKFN